MSEEYGFVYIWFDRKHRRYYIGCHWGKEDDGYICSSSWMKRAYKIRPHDFKRRILTRVFDKILLFEEEGKWLSLIKIDELGKKYYNLHNVSRKHWSSLKEKRDSIGKKISSGNKGKTWSIERRQAWKERCSSEENRIRVSNLSKSFSSELRQQIANTRRGKPIHTEESKKKIGDIHRSRTQSLSERQKRGNSLRGLKRTKEACENISKACKGRIFSEDHRMKLSAAARNRKQGEKD